MPDYTLFFNTPAEAADYMMLSPQQQLAVRKALLKNNALDNECLECNLTDEDSGDESAACHESSET